MAYWFETISDASILKHVDPEWEDYIRNQMQFLRSKSRQIEAGETGAYYNPSCNQMFFSSMNSKHEIRTVFHEYGHFVHYNAFDYDRTNNTISCIFKKEIIKKKIHNEEIGLKFLNYLRTECALPYSISLCPISDALGIYFNTNMFLNNNYSGHKKGYPSCNMGTELFAEIFQMIVLGNSEGLAIFKKEFPKTYYYLSEKINGLRK